MRWRDLEFAVRYLTIILSLISICAFAQGPIFPESIKINPAFSQDSEYMFTTHKTGVYRGRAMLTRVPDFISRYSALIHTDSSWLKLTTHQIPAISDSAYREGYTLFKGLNGGLPTKIEMLKDGVMQFDKDSLSSSRSESLLRFNPLQKSHNNIGFEFDQATTPNANGARNNDVMEFGWGAGNTAVMGEPGIFWSMEDWYQPTAGNDYSEVHLKYRDKSGVEHRPITMSLDHDVFTNWSMGIHIPTIEFRPPDDLDPYIKFSNPNGTQSEIKMLDPVSNLGATIFCDPGSNNLQFLSSMSNSELIQTSFDYTEVKRLQITTAKGDGANKLWGESAGGWHEKITVGDGLLLSSDILSVKLTNHTPSGSSDTGIAGQICYDTNYLYICTATNTWTRIPLAW